MRRQLDQRWKQYLAGLPESGMGYQRVDVRMSDGRTVVDALVFNAQEIELPDDCGDLEINEIRPRIT
jgi:hypothetical protein